MGLELKSTNKAFGGEVRKYSHDSTSTKTPMTFSVYLPPAALLGLEVPAIYYLSGKAAFEIPSRELEVCSFNPPTCEYLCPAIRDVG